MKKAWCLGLISALAMIAGLGAALTEEPKDTPKKPAETKEQTKADSASGRENIEKLIHQLGTDDWETR